MEMEMETRRQRRQRRQQGILPGTGWCQSYRPRRQFDRKLPT